MSNAQRAGSGDLEPLTSTLVSAFLEDPLVAWMFDRPEERESQLERWMRFSLEMGFERGETWGAGEGRAAAIWAPPGVQLFDATWGPRVASLLGELVGERTGEVLQGLARAMEAHGEPEEHYYLFTLGTHAAAQGQGLGACILEPVLGLCDQKGIPARLESSNERNLPFYRRHGFEVTAEVEVAEGGPVVRPMRRAPRAGS